MIVPNDVNLCSAVVTYSIPTATDNCTALTLDSHKWSGIRQHFWPR
jgi:hypothetical protein